MDRETYNEIEREEQSKLMAHNLERVDRLSRRGLMVFLDLQQSKSNTARLRARARLIVIRESAVQISLDLARAAQTEGSKHVT